MNESPTTTGDLPLADHPAIRRKTRTGKQEFLLWFGGLGGGIAWCGHLLLSYGVAEFGCVSKFDGKVLGGISGVAWLEILVTLFSLGLAILATLVARRNGHGLSESSPTDRGEETDSSLFMAQSGVLANGLFTFIIAVQAIPVFFYLRGC